MQTAFLNGRSLLILVCWLWVSACSTPPQPKPITVQERLRLDSHQFSQTVEKFESSVTLRKNSNATAYLNSFARRLADVSEALQGAPVSIYLIKDRDRKWKNYAFPGNKIYLSVGLVKQLSLENELAAVIAFEFANIINRHAANKLEEQTDPAKSKAMAGDFFGPDGLFAFGDAEYLASAKTAVEILYQGGFDTRAMGALWNIHRGSQERAAFRQETLNKLIEKTREVYASYAPLRNPVVTSNEFVAFKKWMEAL